MDYFKQHIYEDDANDEDKFQLEELEELNCKLASNDDGTSAAPGTSIGRLMYYLNCMCVLLNLNNSDIKGIETYKNFELHNRMSLTDKHKILKLCKLLTPKVLINQCIFQVPELCCTPNSNQFYKFTADPSNIKVIMVIGGEEWLQCFYHEPKRELLDELRKAKKRDDCRIS